MSLKFVVLLAVLVAFEAVTVSADRANCLQKMREMLDLADRAMENEKNVTTWEMCNALQGAIDACRDVVPDSTIQQLTRRSHELCPSIHSQDGATGPQINSKDLAQSLKEVAVTE